MKPHETRRNPVLDVYKGLAITLVVLGHVTGVPELLFKFVYSFHMPAFFVISGYLFNAAEAVEKPALAIRKKFFRLVVPAWVMGLLCGIPFVIFLFLGKRGITWEVFLDKLIGTLIGIPNIQHTFLSTPLWFLFCLFVVEAIAILSTLLFQRFSPFALIAIGALGTVSAGFHSVRLPFAIHIAVGACFFFAIGVLLRKYPALDKLRTTITILLALAIWIGLTISSPARLDMAGNHMGTGIGLLANLMAALAGAFLLLVLSTAIVAQDRLATTLLGFLGMNTLPIVGFNYWVNSLALQGLGKWGWSHWSILFVVEICILLALILIIREKGGLLGRLISGSWAPASR